MISYKENLHKFYRHECPDFIPDMRRDFSRVNYAFGKYESHPPMGENGYDGYGVYWFFEPKNRAHMPLQDPKTGKYVMTMDDIENWRDYVKAPSLKFADAEWEAYKAHLERCGMSTLLDIYQTVYDRYMAAK